MVRARDPPPARVPPSRPLGPLPRGVEASQRLATDLGDLIGGLDLDAFFDKIDVDAVVQQIGISPSIVSAAVELIGPKVAEYAPGALGSIAGKLFN